jgi:hypothetical protein
MSAYSEVSDSTCAIGSMFIVAAIGPEAQQDSRGFTNR